MSSNTPGSSSGSHPTSQDPVISPSHHYLRKRPSANVQVRKEEGSSAVPTSSIACQPQAPAHSKLRKISGHCSGQKPESSSTSSDSSSTEVAPKAGPSHHVTLAATGDHVSSSCSSKDSLSTDSSSKTSQTSVPKLSRELRHLINYLPDQGSNDVRLTRSRTRALAAHNDSKPSSSGSSATSAAAHSSKSFFAQGKDKIAKKGREFLKKTERDSKKDHTKAPTASTSAEPPASTAQNFSNASVIVRMNEGSLFHEVLDQAVSGASRTIPFMMPQVPGGVPVIRGGSASTPVSVGNLPGTSHPPVSNNNHPLSRYMNHLHGSIVPRMQHLLAGGSGAAMGHHGLMQSNGRYSSIIEGLRSSNDIRQTEAASELAELLLMGNEESLPNLPIREIVQQLNVLMQKENNMELTLTAVRCITNMQEALPRAMPVLVETIPTLLQKLKHIECIDIAEQTLIALEVMSRRNARSILHAGGFADAVMHVDFFSMPSQRLVYQIAANCASYINGNDFGLVRSCLPDLIQKLTFDDKRCCESICTFFYRIIENYRNSSDRLRDIAGTNFEFLAKIQQLFMTQPSTINQTTFVSLLKSVRYMCIRCSDVVGALIDMEFGRTLRFLLVGSDREDCPVDITLRPPQHTREIIALIGELLPPLPKVELFEVSAVVQQYMSNGIPVPQSNSEAAVRAPVVVMWQFEEEMGDMMEFSPADSGLLEAKRTLGTTEVVLEIAGSSAVVDLNAMRYTSSNGFVGRIDRRVGPSASEQNDTERDAEKEKRDNRLFELIKMLYRVLVDIGSATSCSNLRYESTRVMMRMMLAIENESELRQLLHNLPLASYIASTLSSNKSHTVIVSALQLVHVMLEKLPRLYVPLFDSEGVFHMIQNLISDTADPVTVGADAGAMETKVINLRRGPIEVPVTGSSSASQLSAGPSSASASIQCTNSNDATAYVPTQSSSASVSSADSSVDAPPGYPEASRATAFTNSNVQVYPFMAVGLNGLPIGDANLASNYPRQAIFAGSSYNSLVFPAQVVQNSMAPMDQVSISNQISQDLTYSMQQQVAAIAAMSNQAAPTSGSFRQAITDRLVQWMSKEAQYLITTYHGKDAVYDLDRTVVNELARIAKLFESEKDVGVAPLEALRDLMALNDISPFQLNHSDLTVNLRKYLVDEADTRKPNRTMRLKRFLKVFINLDEHSLRPMDISGEMFAPFERLVTKVVHAIGQLEQFQIKVTNLSGIIQGSSSNTSTVLRGSQALRFFQTHQIRCNLRRHPSCKELREWRQGRSSIKVDPFTSVSAIERYLIDRGIGSSVTSESSSENEGSEDDPEVASNEGSNIQPFTGRIEILIGEHRVPSDLSILQAICQYSLSQDEEVIPPSVWVNAHTLYFRVAPRDANDSSTPTAVSGSVKKSRKSYSKKLIKSCKNSVYYTGIIPRRKNPIEPYLKSKLEIEFSDPCVESCVLLKALYGLNRYWWTLFDGGLPTTHEPILPSATFHCSKLNSKVQRQLSDFLSVATQQVPKWTTNIVKCMPFMFTFLCRRSLLYCTAFGRDRALMHIVTEGNEDHDGAEATSRLVPRLERRKVAVKRHNLLADAVSTFNQMHTSKAQLEVNFDGEIGTGFGPTLEFYSTISRELQKHHHGFWVGSSQPFSFNEGNETEDYTVADSGLYPIPINRHTKNVKTDGRSKRFEFIGRLLAQALIDSRMLDIPFSSIFFKWLMNTDETLGPADMEVLDPMLYKSLRGIASYSDPEDFEALQQAFTMPGDDSFELLKGGHKELVTKDNVQKFVDLVIHWRLVEGVREEMMALKKGFEQVIDVATLSIFSEHEMEELFCGCSESSAENDKIWSKAALQQAIRPDHGYTHESPQIAWLVDMLHGFSLEDRRKFLQFCTGSPRLPVGGFRGLNPALTVVRKIVAYGNSESELPSAMTCYNFLKIPPYTSYETFVERFQVALQFIYSFHLT